ncbi:MAG: CBS domain-containing protein, partial [bacterium]
CDLDATPIGEVMTPEPECLTLDDGIAYALNIMHDGGFRRIPLVDDDGHPTGVVTMRNIVDDIVDLFAHEVLNLPPKPTSEIVREREGA